MESTAWNKVHVRYANRYSYRETETVQGQDDSASLTCKALDFTHAKLMSKTHR